MGKTYDLINESFTKKYSDLSEEVLDEKIPKDLARAYKDNYGDGTSVQYNNQIGSYRYKALNTDYENANYTEITPEQAKQMKKNGEDLSKLRIVMRKRFGDGKDTMYLTFNRDGTPKHHTGPHYGVANKDGYSYMKKTGNTEKDSRKIPFNWICDNALKIYVTDEDTVHVSPEKMTRRDIPEDDWSSNLYRKKLSLGHSDSIRSSKRDIARAKRQIQIATDKFNSGELSQEDFDKIISRQTDNINWAQGRIKRERNNINQDNRYLNDYEANHEFAKVERQFNRLKSQLTYAKGDLRALQLGYDTRVADRQDSEVYSSKKRRIEQLTDLISEYTTELRKLEKELSQKGIDADIQKYETDLANQQAKISDIQNQIDTMLHRNK